MAPPLWRGIVPASQLIIAVDDDVLASEAHRHKAGVHRDVSSTDAMRHASCR